ncbi:MAG: hypothetical protein HUK20_04790 [Fibrobacter sp.]|nr:hypothetical protein [Fibrobacter sp.]
MAHDRCPLLTDNGLCKIICNCGESYLSDICREHPRFVEVYGDIMEKGIGLCCEEGAKLLLGCKLPFRYNEKNCNEKADKITHEITIARDNILDNREQMLQLIASPKISLHSTLRHIFDIEDISNRACNLEPGDIIKHWIRAIDQCESFGPAWDLAIKRIYQKIDGCGVVNLRPLFSETDGKKIVSYMIFRYYAKCLFDGDSLGKVKFATFFWIILKNFEHELSDGAQSIKNKKINAIKLLSKQLEYSEEVLDKLNSHFKKSKYFSSGCFKRLLTT